MLVRLRLAPHLAALLFAWLPMFALALVEGNAFGGSPVPFFRDYDVQVRFLVSLPLLIWRRATRIAP